MKSLIRLIGRLEPQEIRFVQDYHVASRSKQRSDLFNRIVNGKIKSNTDALEQLYKGKANAASALSHLKKKLREDILNLILVLAPESDSSATENKEILCEKLILQSEILFAKGLQEEGMELLEKTMKLADKYDLPQINLSTYYLLLENRQFPDIRDVKRRFESSISRFRDLVEAKSAYYSGENEHSPDIPEEKLNAPCHRTAYWRRMNSIEQLCRDGDFKQARDNALILLSCVRKDKLLYSREKDAQISRLLAGVHMHLGLYPEAVGYARESLENTRTGSDENILSLEYLFLSFLRAEMYPQAEELIGSVPAGLKDNCIRNRWLFNQAALSFYQKNYRQVSVILGSWNCKHTVDQVWKIAPRFLELLSILEQEDYDWFVYRFECLRKKLGQFNGNVPVRMKLIYQLFNQVIQHHFCLESVIHAQSGTLLKLSGNQPEYRWDPLGHERVNIPGWLISKKPKLNLFHT